MVIEKGVLKLSLLDQDEREFCFTEPDGFPRYQLNELEFHQTEPEAAHIGILKNFTNAVLYGEELIAPGYDGIREITISNAAYLSSWTGKKVSVKNFDSSLFDSLLKEKIDNSKPKVAGCSNAEGQACRWQTNW